MHGRGSGKSIIMVIDVILEESFKGWLVAMGYADSTVYGSVHYLRDFLEWLQLSGIKEPGQVDGIVVRRYYEHLQKRKSRRNTGSLSSNYINSNMGALKRFSRYLEQTGRGVLEIDLKRRVITTGARIVLSKEDIQSMYRVCGQVSESHAELLGIRDRAIIGIFYGCGLRRSEGEALNVTDILVKEKLVVVSKGKNYRQRYVPMTEKVKEDLVEYIQVARKKILGFKGTRHDALFLSMQVNRLCGNQLISRIQLLAKTAGVQKSVGLHMLRHSIATHLLQAGMSLEEISRFLGHASLESTQIYTHILHEQNS